MKKKTFVEILFGIVLIGLMVLSLPFKLFATDYGLRIKLANGTVVFDTTDIVARVRYYADVDAGVDGSTTLSDIAGNTTYAFSIPLEYTA